MERSAYRQHNRPFSAGFLEFGRSSLNSCRLTRNNNLAGTIEINGLNRLTGVNRQVSSRPVGMLWSADCHEGVGCRCEVNASLALTRGSGDPEPFIRIGTVLPAIDGWYELGAVSVPASGKSDSR